MKPLHSQEKEQFKKLFKQDHVEDFEDRYRILDSFLQTEKHVTVNELVEILHENGCRFEPDFVRETLKMMCRYGFAQKNRFDNGAVRFEHRHLGQHHDHMICTKCKRIVEFKNQSLENLQAKIAVENGFHMLQHKMEIYGICSECLKDRIKQMPLSAAKQGETLTVQDYLGGAGVRMRLLSMGIRIGDTVEVITNMNQGEMVIALGHTRYSLGRGLAQKVLVQPNKQ